MYERNWLYFFLLAFYILKFIVISWKVCMFQKFVNKLKLFMHVLHFSYPCLECWLLCLHRQYILWVPSVIQSHSTEQACLHLLNLNESVSLSVVLEYDGSNSTIFDQTVQEENFHSCANFEVRCRIWHFRISGGKMELLLKNEFCVCFSIAGL